MNKKIQSLQIIDNIYVYDYTNLDVKTSRMPKKIYNFETIQKIYDNSKEKYKKKKKVHELIK